MNIEPDSPKVHSALGRLYWMANDREKAETEFEKASELAPMGSREQIKLAYFYVFTGKTELAKELLGKIVEQSPDNIPAWRLLAQISYAEKNYEDSTVAIEKVLEKNPSDLEAFFVRGVNPLGQT